MSNPAIDEAIARLVKQLLMATEVQLDAARKLQGAGGAASLAEALVKNGVITVAQREAVESRLEAQRQAGNHLGPYKLLRKLGEGGMGAVYLAQEPADGRLVALKVLPKRHSKDGDFLGRFKREAEAAIQLNHVNIARAYSAGEERGHAYYAMEYCEGEPLKERLKREKFLPAETALGLVMQIARGLKYAHDLGFIHRDIKPDNVIVTPQNVVKILDLGLAKNIEDAEQSFRTQTGVAIGTPHYIAPEQARGDKDIDGRADIYSLGATFYHLVTGDTPFHGSSSYEIITKHLTEQLPDPRDLREDIPENVVHVIRRMMAKTPEDRYKDCAELLIDLELVIDGKSPSSQALDAGRSSVAMPKRLRRRQGATPPAPKEKDMKPVDGKKRKLLLIGGAIAAVAVVAILAAVTMSGSPPPQKASPAKDAVVVVAPKPPVVVKTPAMAPVEPEVKLTPEEAREREAQRKLDRIKALEKLVGANPMEIQGQYDRFAVEYADTAAGRVIASWLKSKLPKEPAPEIPVVAAAPTEKPAPEAPAPAPAAPPVAETPKPAPPPTPEPGKGAVPPLQRASRAAHPAFAVKPGNGLLGAYYTSDDGSFKSAPVFFRVDPVISFDWGEASPDPRISTDNFSVRWTGEIMPLYSELYTFDVIVDEKVRLWVDGKLIVDRWAGQPATPTIPLQGGVRYELKMEYNDSQLTAWARLVWASPSTPQQLVPRSQLYSTPTARIDERPVPAAALQKEAASKLREKFTADFKISTRAGKEALSRKLVESGTTEADLDVRYQALKEGQDLALAVGLGGTAVSAIEQLADTFEVDALDLKAAALRKLIPGAVTKPDAAAISSMFIDLIDEAIRMDKYDQATEYIKAADRPARLTENELVLVQLQGRAAQVPELKREWDRIKQAVEKLKSTPEDPGASQIVGEFRAFFKREFWKGLPLLKLGTDPLLKSLAELELGNSDDARVQQEACELWLTLAEREKNLTKKLTQADRARFWLFRASGNAVKGLLDGARKRIAAVEDAMAAKMAIDLLKIAELPPNGKRASDGSILAASIVTLPYIPPEEYDFTVVVQVQEGASVAYGALIGLALPPGEGFFRCGYSGTWNSSWLDYVWNSNKDGAPRGGIGRSAKFLAAALPHTVKCYVRREALTIAFDGELAMTWGGPFDTIRHSPAEVGPLTPKGALLLGSGDAIPLKYSKAVIVPYRLPGRNLRAK